MVRTHRRKGSKLGLIAGLLLLGTAAAFVLAAGVLLGLTFINITTALLGFFLPAAALSVIGVAVWWLARAESRGYRQPPAQVRLDMLRASYGQAPAPLTGRSAVKNNGVPSGRWQA